ncbi:retrovirus-related pol polyprotein from transposon TNT 1-94 [Tanacetum coccineum]
MQVRCPQFREDLKSLRDSKGKRKVDGGEMNVVDNGSDEFLMTELNGMGILREKNKVVFGKYQASTHICNDRMASDMSKFSIPMFDGKMDFMMWKMTIEDVFGTTRRKAFSTIRFMSPEIKYIQCFEGEDNRRNLGQAHEYNASKSLTHRLFLKMELYSLKLEEGSNLHDHINSFNPLVCQLANVDDAIKDEEQALLMLSSLPKSYKSFVQTMLTGRTILTFEDVLKVEIPRGSSKGRSKSRMGEDRDMSVVECYYYGDTGHMQVRCPQFREDLKCLRDSKGKRKVDGGEIECDAEYLIEIDGARRELRALIFNKQCAHVMLRLAWHDAATYNEHSKTGGPNGSIRIQDVYSRESNNGLKFAIDYCGVVAIEIIGGPIIDFVPGRKVR